MKPSTFLGTLALSFVAVASHANGYYGNHYGSDWQFKMGMGGVFSAETKGVDEMDFTWIPYFDVAYKDWLEANPRDGITVSLPTSTVPLPITWALGVGLDYGRDAQDAGLLGLSDVDITPEIRLKETLDFGHSKIEGTIGLATGNTGHSGAYGQLEATTQQRLTDRWMMDFL